MKTLKVMDLINKLNEIGYDEKTELTFSCVDGETGECEGRRERRCASSCRTLHREWQENHREVRTNCVPHR